MIWEANDETCKNIEVAGEKILEIFNGWHIDKVAYSDEKWGKDMNSLGLVIRRDTRDTCEGCKYATDRNSYDRCRRCSRNNIDRYERE